jgi:hypothetical protein
MGLGGIKDEAGIIQLVKTKEVMSFMWKDGSREKLK